MCRILVFGMTENPGGVESFLITYYRNIDRSIIQFDFLCNFYEPAAYEDELISLGANVYHIVSRKENRKRFRKELDELFMKHSCEWDAIWVNVCILANIDYLKTAKKYGISKRIIHSHNSQNMDGTLRGILHLCNKQLIHKYATDFWACSIPAAKWFYKKELMDKVEIIHNAIDAEKMRFDPEKRNELRKKYHWENKNIIGNIGRLHFQKNQEFVIRVFNQYHYSHPDSLLVLVGQGEDEPKLKKAVQKYCLEDFVYFAGVQKDIQAWLSCFDLFLFPSRFEGLGIAILEAEANGLPVIASASVIPDEVKINSNYTSISLDSDLSVWCETIEKMAQVGRIDNETAKKSISEKGYDIETETAKLERLLAE